MYHLINTMNAFDCMVGRVISSHRTLDAAREADRKVQRAVRRNSPTSYLPTSIVKVQGSARQGDWIERLDLVEFDER